VKTAEGILIHEVGPRDGLQAESVVVPLDVKLRWIEDLFASGVDIIQVGSFVHPAKMPQMADTDELFRRLNSSGTKPAHVTLSGLVLNERGLERGFDVGVDMFCMGVSASETHSRRNTGMTSDEALARVIPMAIRAQSAGKKVQVSVQSAFGCGFEGRISGERVIDIVKAYFDAGLHNISLADTAGHANPLQVEELYGEVRRLEPGAELACHFHNTYGLGLANCYAALRSGVTSFESAFGGLGGCPFTKVPAGNVSSEDLVHSLQRMGYRTDVRLDVLLEAARNVGDWFGRELPGLVLRSGPIEAEANNVV
jgi:hydroxymethylglutaryl-CoA lyase